MDRMAADHYFSAEPATADRRHRIEFTVGGREYALNTTAGVFSFDRLDPGTAVLLRKADLPGPDTTARLLDLGCGYGPITCVLASIAPQARVWAVDVNARARDLTRENADRMGLGPRVTVSAPEEVPADATFDEIWSNPPIRVGKGELHGMLRRWLPRLRPDGTAWLVVARHLGGDSLHRWLSDEGWQVDRHASQKGYRVLRVRG
jgi:16S rRNA (guanine1207-N2)-methyltransferase